MKIKPTDNLHFKVVAPLSVGDLKFGSNLKVRGKALHQVPLGLLLYLDRARPSTRAEFLAASGVDISGYYDNVGILFFEQATVPELSFLPGAQADKKYKVKDFLFNPNIKEVKLESYIQGMNFLQEEFNNPSKQTIYKGTVLYRVEFNGKLLPVREEIVLEYPKEYKADN